MIQVSYCSIDEDHLRIDCKYALPAESSEAFCKFTQGARLLDTTDPEEEQHAPYKHRARARIFPGNVCRLLFKNLPKGKSNFTCNIKQADSATVSKTSVVEKSKLRLLILDNCCTTAVHILLFCTHKQTTFEWLPNKTLLRRYFFLLQSSSSPAQPGVSCYKAAVACCWPWWHFPCYWRFTGCEQGAKLLHTNTAPRHLGMWLSGGCVLNWMCTLYTEWLVYDYRLAVNQHYSHI